MSFPASIARFIPPIGWRHRLGDIPSRPEWLVLCVNNFCNLRCKMCDVGLRASDTVFYANLVGDDPRNMSFDLLQTVLDQALSFSAPPRIGLAFTEPLLHPQIVDFCRAIGRRGLYSSITTNGYRLKPLARDIVASGLDQVTVSVDGPEEVHDRIRGKKGSFACLYEGIEEVNRIRAQTGSPRPKVQISFTMTDENTIHMVELVRQMEPLKPSSFVFSHLNFISSAMAEAHNARHNGSLRVTRSNLGPMELDRMDLDAFWGELQKLKEALRSPSHWTFEIVPDFKRRADLEIYYRDPLTFVGGRTCTDPWKMMMILTDGTVIPAHGRCYHVPLGRVTETPLPEIWNGPTLSRFRDTLRRAGGTLPACSRCCGVIGKPKGLALWRRRP